MKKLILAFATVMMASGCRSQEASFAPEYRKALRHITPDEMAQKRLDDAIWLSTRLNMPLTSNSQVWTTSLFPSTGIITTNEYRIIAPGTKEDNEITFSVYSNDLSVAFGTLFEYPTFNEARTALMLELINNNMMREALVDSYRIRTNNVGDFSVVWLARNAADEITDDLSWIYFIRGAKAVSLRGKDVANVQPIAEILDMLLRQSPNTP